MRLDKWLSPRLDEIAQEARLCEAQGFDALWVPETTVDPFLPIAVAAGNTEHIDLGIGVAVAFARSPMTVAQAAWNLQDHSGGRLILGLGSQIKAHIERRYSMPWSHPAARMREYVLTLRSIWACWQDGTNLRFEGDFFTHTLMTPFFDPGPIRTQPPRIFLAAVGARMTAVAGEVADGMLVHSLCTPSYVRDVTVPTLEAALDRAGRAREHFELSQRVFLVTGNDEAQTEQVKDATRQQIAFYGSTPAYRPILEHHGLGALHDELNLISKRGDWDEMGRLIGDDVLDEFAIVAPPDEVPERIIARVGDLVDRVTLYTPAGIDPTLAAAVRIGIERLDG